MKHLGLGQFAKGNAVGKSTPRYPLADLPDYECSFVSPRALSADYVPLTDQPNIGFDDLLEVIEVSQTVRRGEPWPESYAQTHGLGTEPTPIFQHGGYRRAWDLVELVTMDKPLDLWRLAVAYLDKIGTPRRNRFNYTPFIERQGELAEATTIVWAALDVAFDEKWHYGQARPEELAGWNFTNESIGCPNHPSYPAGHSAVGGATEELLGHQYELTDSLRQMVGLTSVQFGHSRTILGHHFAQDNYAGRKTGRAVAAVELAKLSEP